MQNVMPDGLAVLVNTFHNFDGIQYLVDLYEALMSSIDRKGTLKNFRNNVSLLKLIVDDHWGTALCIRDLSAALAYERAVIFKPYFDTAFNMQGL